MAKLNLDRDVIDQCRELAESIVRPIQSYINRHSTVSIERTVLRLLGFDGAYELEAGMPFPMANLIVDKLERPVLANGVASVIAAIKNKYPRWEQAKIGEKIIRGEIDFKELEDLPQDQITKTLKPWVDSAIRHIDKMRYTRQDKIHDLGSGRSPLKYVIVATGNIYEDVKHALSAARLGADIISYFKSMAKEMGVPYQNLINLYLRDCVQAHRKIEWLAR